MPTPVAAITAAAPAGSGAAVRKPGDDPQRIGDAARQFESLLIAQLLKSMRASGTGGWLGTGEDEAGAQAVEVAEEQMAQALAQQGGLGLAHLVVAGLQSAGHAPPAGKHPGAQKLQP